MGSAEQQGELWGKAARDWAELQEPLTRPLWAAMLDAGDVGEGTRVCDVGCGGGGASVLAADRGAVVSGIDAAEALVEIARARVTDGNFPIQAALEQVSADELAGEVRSALSAFEEPDGRIAFENTFQYVVARPPEAT